MLTWVLSLPSIQKQDIFEIYSFIPVMGGDRIAHKGACVSNTSAENCYSKSVTLPAPGRHNRLHVSVVHKTFQKDATQTTTVYSLDLITARSETWADISIFDTMWVFQSAWIQGGSVERINTVVIGEKYLAERRDNDGPGGGTDMESHLILPVKLQNWGFEDNSK